jgi:hypothetical protein
VHCNAHLDFGQEFLDEGLQQRVRQRGEEPVLAPHQRGGRVVSGELEAVVVLVVVAVVAAAVEASRVLLAPPHRAPVAHGLESVTAQPAPICCGEEDRRGTIGQ